VTELDESAAALRTAVSRLARRLRIEGGQEEYSTSQVAVLQTLLESGPTTTAELARAQDMRPQSMSAIVAALEAAGIVGRRPDPDDGRAVQVFVTPEGRHAILVGRAAKQSWLIRTMTERLTPAEQHTLRDAAALIERLLDPRPERTTP
jgi:DNA-binding MarR family transcriptional regulator